VANWRKFNFQVRCCFCYVANSQSTEGRSLDCRFKFYRSHLCVLQQPLRYTTLSTHSAFLLQCLGQFSTCGTVKWVLPVGLSNDSKWLQQIWAHFTVELNCPFCFDLVWGGCHRHMALILHLSSEPGELLQWFFRDDSEINIIFLLCLLKYH